MRATRMKKYDNMASKHPSGTSWTPRIVSSSDVQLHVCGMPFSLDKELLAAKSAKVAMLLKENRQEDLSHLLKDIPATPETFEHVARFCHGFESNLSSENVIPVYCLAHYLGMSENHSSNNLLEKALSFFQHKIITSWNHSIKALKTAENIFQYAVNLGLVDACVETLITKALAIPRLLGEPIKNMASDDDSDNNENAQWPNARRQLFVSDWQSEDLTKLSIQLYEPIIRAMIQRKVPIEYATSSICQYVKKWIFSENKAQEEDMSIYKRMNHREIIEAVERVLPNERGIFPCTLLFEMLQLSFALEASLDCRNGFEIRIGKQLHQATVKDLLIPSQGYIKEEQYDIECVRRILKNFYCNYSGKDTSGLYKVTTLVEDFLAEIAIDIDLKREAFISLAEMAIAASVEIQRSSDGIYRAIDIYLDKHKYLTESEKVELCQILDCNKMSPEACEHAAQNQRLPLRVVVQVLFIAQLQLRNTVTKGILQDSDGKLRLSEDVGEVEEEGKLGSSEEVEKLENKVMELKKECHLMKREILGGYNDKTAKREKNSSMWKEMKRKFGCISGLHDCDCHLKKKKVHPR